MSCCTSVASALTWNIKFDNPVSQWEDVYMQVLSTDSMSYPQDVHWSGRLMEPDGEQGCLSLSFDWDDEREYTSA